MLGEECVHAALESEGDAETVCMRRVGSRDLEGAAEKIGGIVDRGDSKAFLARDHERQFEFCLGRELEINFPDVVGSDEERVAGGAELAPETVVFEELR